MRCRHCDREIEGGFQFCPKCGRSLKAATWFLTDPQGQRTVRWGVAITATLLVVGLVVIAVRHNQISRLKQGTRDGVAYVAWLADELPAASTLELAIGKPFRSVQVSNGRSIIWFRIRDGFLGMESASGIFHFRPDKPLSQEVLTNYQRRSDTLSVANELLTTYDGPNDLGLTALASDKRPSVLTELIVWKRGAN